jgi:hypothetical protein
MNCFLDAVDTQHYRNICKKHATRGHCFDSRTLHYKKQFKKIVPQKLNAILFFDIGFFKYFFRVLHEASSSWLKFCRSILGHPVYLVICMLTSAPLRLVAEDRPTLSPSQHLRTTDGPARASIRDRDTKTKKDLHRDNKKQNKLLLMTVSVKNIRK